MADFSIYEELMPKIQALIAPPDNTNAGTSRDKNSSDIHPHFKRRGKRHNHDYCDACGERGNVLYCDICPASFHLLCHDPPLNEKVVLNGHWTCNACQHSEKNGQQNEAKELSQQRTDQQRSSKETSIELTPNENINHVETSAVNHQTSSKTTPPKVDDFSIILRDSIRVKHESIEEVNVGSELDESSDNASVADKQIKTECVDIDPKTPTNSQSNLEFPLKIEPDTEYHDSAAEDDTNDVQDINMDDVWKIIGIDNQVRINAGKHDDRKISEDGASISKNSSDVETINLMESAKRKQINVSLMNCDYMLSRKNSCVIHESSDETSKKKRSVRKLKGSRCQNNLFNEDHVAGIQNVFANIIENASKLNPKQFTLPIDYITNVDMNIIGTEKDPESFPNDFDSSDLLKLPARKCYYCKGTCLSGQMISCDFCPAHFHLNCLNPPLCNIPDVKWMCPLHPHHVLERVMKNPSSITELMSWWSKFSVPIDDEDVKSNFIKKVKSHDKRSTNRKFIHSSVKIPDIVKFHYKHPIPRMPSLEELVQSKNDCVFENSTFSLTKHDVTEKTNNCCSSETQVITPIEQEPRIEPEAPKITPDPPPDPTPAPTNNVVQKKYNLRPHRRAKWKTLLDIASNHRHTNSDQRSTKKSSKAVQEETKKTDAEPQPSHSDVVMSNNDFTFKSQGIYSSDRFFEKQSAENSIQTDLCWKKIENYIIRDINKNFITGGVSITTLSEDIRRLLMIQMIKQYTQDLPPSFVPNTNPYPMLHPLIKDNINDTLSGKPKGNVKAVLCPLSHRPLIYMYGQSLSIGSGFSNDVCLLHYGNCNFISDDHAVIFYDKITNTYELINYSEYNTIVDGVCYTCDISRNGVEKGKQAPKTDKTPVTKPTKIPPKKKPITSSVCCDTETKRTGSTVMAAEARSIYKKLLNDIDRLVSKSQEEMSTIAEEDLNEISKAIKNTPTNSNPHQEMSNKKPMKKKKIISNKRKAPEKSDNGDSKASKIPRKTQNTIKQNTETIEDTPPVTLQKPPKPTAQPQEPPAAKRRPTRSKRRRIGRVKKSKKTKTTKSKIASDDVDRAKHTESDHSDAEYILGDDLFVNPKRKQCRCQSNRVEFPNGRDSSWERSAVLNHGSYVRFGCIEFIFSIVHYPVPFEERIYAASKPHPNPQQPPPPTEPQPQSVSTEQPLLGFYRENKDDLSLKLMSILNLLSSKSSDKDSSSPSHASPSSSSFSSRSNSPVLHNGNVDDPETPTEHVDGQIEITG